jgi:hypothetical protein
MRWSGNSKSYGVSVHCPAWSRVLETGDVIPAGAVAVTVNVRGGVPAAENAVVHEKLFALKYVPEKSVGINPNEIIGGWFAP